MKPLIFDATPLIYLGKVNLIEKMKHFPEEKYTTESIYREVVEEGKKGGHLQHQSLLCMHCIQYIHDRSKCIGEGSGGCIQGT